MTVSEPITVSSFWRRKLRIRAALSLAGVACANAALLVALFAPSYHHGVISSPILAPIFVDVSLFTLNMYSECNLLMEFSPTNPLNKLCANLIREVDGLALTDTKFTTCNFDKSLVLSDLFCRTLASLKLAAAVVKPCLTMGIFLNFLQGVIHLIIMSKSFDTLGKRRRRLIERAGPKVVMDQPHLFDEINEEYNHDQMSLASLRLTARILAVGVSLIVPWAVLAYPLLGQSIHFQFKTYGVAGGAKNHLSDI